MIILVIHTNVNPVHFLHVHDLPAWLLQTFECATPLLDFSFFKFFHSFRCPGQISSYYQWLLIFSHQCSCWTNAYQIFELHQKKYSSSGTNSHAFCTSLLVQRIIICDLNYWSSLLTAPPTSILDCSLFIHNTETREIVLKCKSLHASFRFNTFQWYFIFTRKTSTIIQMDYRIHKSSSLFLL